MSAEVWSLSAQSTVFVTPSAEVVGIAEEWAGDFGSIVNVEITDADVWTWRDRTKVCEHLLSAAAARHLDAVVAFRDDAKHPPRMYAFPGRTWLRARAMCKKRTTAAVVQRADAVIEAVQRRRAAAAQRFDPAEFALPVAESAADAHPLVRSIDTTKVMVCMAAAVAACTFYYRATTTARVQFQALSFMFWLPSAVVAVLFHRMRLAELRIRLTQGGDVESTVPTAMSDTPVLAFAAYAAAFVAYTLLQLGRTAPSPSLAVLLGTVFFVSIAASGVLLQRFRNSMIVAGV